MHEVNELVVSGTSVILQEVRLESHPVRASRFLLRQKIISSNFKGSVTTITHLNELSLHHFPDRKRNPVLTVPFANISSDAGHRSYLCISMFNMWTCSDRNTASAELQFAKYYLNFRKCKTGKTRSTSN